MIPGSCSTLLDFSIVIPVIEKSYLMKSFGKICYFQSVHFPCEKVFSQAAHINRRQFFLIFNALLFDFYEGILSRLFQN